jgi:ADP-heptose:LPS heptosyltransferase
MKGFSRTYTTPFKHHIPNYTNEFLKQNSIIFRWIKFFKRYLYIFFKKQKSLEVFKISSRHKNILWINISASSLGDSLMDLSGRILLKDKRLDLFTDIKNVHLYKSDNIFKGVYSNLNDINDINYDLIIIDSYSTRSIKVKAKVAPKVSFVGVFGYFNGPEVNRVLFSFHQINKLLGYSKSKDDINQLAISSISISAADKSSITSLRLPSSYIAIAIGGEWPYRTYDKWVEVIEELLVYDYNSNIVIIGSGNATEMSKKITDRFASKRLFNLVNQFSFCQTTEIIKNASLVICCDGGLMHAANASKKIIIVLLARLSVEMQLTKLSKCFEIYDESNVNNIPVKKVFQKYKEAIKSLEL